MESEKYTYVLTETAGNDFDEILSYLAVNLKNPEAASSFADEFEKKITDICGRPKTGVPVENKYLRISAVRWFSVKNYMIYYITDERMRRIAILRIVFRGRNQNTVLKTI